MFERSKGAGQKSSRSEVRGQIAEVQSPYRRGFYFCNLTSDLCNQAVWPAFTLALMHFDRNQFPFVLPHRPIIH